MYSFIRASNIEYSDLIGMFSNNILWAAGLGVWGAVARPFFPVNVIHNNLLKNPKIKSYEA